jgi:glycosyltransferase involved in cell wall biosynthesis
MQRLTVLITCKDERANIEPCLESVVGIADELLIADSGSTDGTLEYVRDRGDCRVIEREYVTAGDFRNWAIAQARHEWVLLVDADERVTPELAASIRAALAADPDCDGFTMVRVNYLMGREVRHTDWARDYLIRLFRREAAWYNPLNDHAIAEFRSQRIGSLAGRLDHYSLWSWGPYLQKFDRYTRLQAERWYAEGRRPSYASMMVRPPLRFLRDYVLHRGFLDGMIGLQLSMMAAFYAFMKQARLWELHRGLTPADAEAERQARPVEPARPAVGMSRRAHRRVVHVSTRNRMACR